MDNRMFRILLIPMYLLVGLLLFLIMVRAVHSLNIFFYIITLLLIPCAGLLSLPDRSLLNLAGMAGFVALGILLPATQPLEFEFQGFNGWILLGGIAVIFGVGGFVYGRRQRD